MPRLLGTSSKALEDEEINQIRGQNIDPDLKINEVESESSFSEAPKSLDSFQIISAMLNTMIGTTCLILPLKFNSCGLISSLMVVALICFSASRTCVLYCIHAREDDEDILLLVKKFAGYWPYVIYKIFNTLLLLATSVVLYLLSVNMCFAAGSYLASKLDIPCAAGDLITLEEFSKTWCSLFCAAICFGFICLKDISTIVELGKYGSYGLHIFTLFVIGTAIQNIFSEGFSFGELKMFDWSFYEMGGIMAMAFMVHPTCLPIVKRHKEPAKIERDVSVSFVISALMYSAYGIFGAIALVGKNVGGAETFTDYFNNIYGFLIQIIFILTLVTAYPILATCGRTAFFDVLTENCISYRKKLVFNFVLMSLTLLFGILQVEILSVIQFTAAIFGFYVAYIAPIWVHFGCVSNMRAHKTNPTRSSLVSTCHHQEVTDSWAELYFYYGFVTLIGLAIAVLTVYSVFW